MKKVTAKFSAENAYGKAVKDYGIHVDGKLLEKVEGETPEYTEYETIAEIPESEKLTDKQYLQAVNARTKASVKAKATEAALDAVGIKKPSADDPEVIRENNIKLLMKTHNISREEAEDVQTQNDQMVAALKAAKAAKAAAAATA